MFDNVFNAVPDGVKVTFTNADALSYIPYTTTSSLYISDDYIKRDLKKLMNFITPMPNISADRLSSKIERVIFNDPATIVIWDDGSKTVVKCNDGDTYNKEVGLTACIVKKICGNTGRWNEILKKWCCEEKDNG